MNKWFSLLLFCFVAGSVIIFSQTKQTRIVQLAKCGATGFATLSFEDSDSDGKYDIAVETLCDGKITKLPLQFSDAKDLIPVAGNVSVGIIKCSQSTKHSFSWDSVKQTPKSVVTPPEVLVSDLRYSLFFGTESEFIVAERNCTNDIILVRNATMSSSVELDKEHIWISFQGYDNDILKFHIATIEEGDATITITDMHNNKLAEKKQFLIDERDKPLSQRNFVLFKNMHLLPGTYLIKVALTRSFKTEKFIIGD